MTPTALSLTSTAVMALFLMEQGPAPAPGIFSHVIDAGTAGILLFIWWKTFQSGREETKNMRENALKMHRESVEETRRQARLQHDEHVQARRETRQLIKEIHQTQETLSGTLMRLETKLDNYDDS